MSRTRGSSSDSRRTVDHAQTLSAQERLEALCDAGSLTFLRSRVTSPRMGTRARRGDGVVVAIGRVESRPVVCYAQDPSYLRGSVGTMHAESIVMALRLAGRAAAPVVAFIESGGARLQEGLAALGGYGRIFREHVALSGRVPQISVMCGPSVGGGSYAPALTDFIVMTQHASMFLTGPKVVRQVTGEEVDTATLGGPCVHERNGVVQLSADTELDAACLVRELLGYITNQRPNPAPYSDQAAPRVPSPDATVPAAARRVYDVRDVVRAIVDGGRLLELSPRWGRSVVCAFARLGGRPVGVVANQPRFLGGALCADSAEKSAWFVRTCNTFRVPLVVLVDTPGFVPGRKEERRAAIRHGAELIRAFAEASVPKVTVILRKAFGGALITMNSRALGADCVFVWAGAELGVMGAGPAVSIVGRQDPASASRVMADHSQLAKQYAAEHLSAAIAAANGEVDEVIAPAQTRDRLIAVLSLLADGGPRGGTEIAQPRH
jgi:acetyl-CoA carboxylase carboxyltransferase component